MARNVEYDPEAPEGPEDGSNRTVQNEIAFTWRIASPAAANPRDFGQTAKGTLILDCGDIAFATIEIVCELQDKQKTVLGRGDRTPQHPIPRLSPQTSTSLFDELLDDHVNDFVDVAQRFFSRAPRRCAAETLKGRAIGVPC